MDKTLILTGAEMDQKMERLVHQVNEVCFEEEEIILCGIEGNGTTICEYIANKLTEISDLKIKVCTLKMDKENPVGKTPELSISSSEYKNKTIVVIDDVSNSGKTILHAVKSFMDVPLKSIKTLVLVDRDHNRYPVKMNFTGLSISTTLKEHIEVSMGEDKGVYLR